MAGDMSDEKALQAEEAYRVDKAAVEGKQCRDDEGAAGLGHGQETNLVSFCSRPSDAWSGFKTPNKSSLSTPQKAFWLDAGILADHAAAWACP